MSLSAINRLKNIALVVGMVVLPVFSAACLVLSTPSEMACLPGNDSPGLIASSRFFVHESLSGDSHTPPGTMLFLSSPALVSGCTVNETVPVSQSSSINVTPGDDIRRFDSHTTTASISPHKAAEFTLVGAKPSGTS